MDKFRAQDDLPKDNVQWSSVSSLLYVNMHGRHARDKEGQDWTNLVAISMSLTENYIWVHGIVFC